jgi:hypothetical protein
MESSELRKRTSILVSQCIVESGSRVSLRRRPRTCERSRGWRALPRRCGSPCECARIPRARRSRDKPSNGQSIRTRAAPNGVRRQGSNSLRGRNSCTPQGILALDTLRHLAKESTVTDRRNRVESSRINHSLFTGLRRARVGRMLFRSDDGASLRHHSPNRWKSCQKTVPWIPRCNSNATLVVLAVVHGLVSS